MPTKWTRNNSAGANPNHNDNHCNARNADNNNINNENSPEAAEPNGGHQAPGEQLIGRLAGQLSRSIIDEALERLAGLGGPQPAAELGPLAPSGAHQADQAGQLGLILEAAEPQERRKLAELLAWLNWSSSSGRLAGELDAILALLDRRRQQAPRAPGASSKPEEGAGLEPLLAKLGQERQQLEDLVGRLERLRGQPDGRPSEPSGGQSPRVAGASDRAPARGRPPPPPPASGPAIKPNLSASVQRMKRMDTLKLRRIKRQKEQLQGHPEPEGQQQLLARAGSSGSSVWSGEPKLPIAEELEEEDGAGDLEHDDDELAERQMLGPTRAGSSGPHGSQPEPPCTAEPRANPQVGSPGRGPTTSAHSLKASLVGLVCDVSQRGKSKARRMGQNLFAKLSSPCASPVRTRANVS